MKTSEAFPSNYIKAADLDGRQITVKMDRAEYEKIGNDRKLVLFFQGKEKGMVLNKTNANTIAYAYGDETEDWAGQEIVLFEAMVDYQGKSVPAIRVKAPPRKPAQRQDGNTAPQRRQARDDMDDEIPF